MKRQQEKQPQVLKTVIACILSRPLAQMGRTLAATSGKRNDRGNRIPTSMLGRKRQRKKEQGARLPSRHG